MSTIQSALRNAGLSSAPDTPEQPKIRVRQPVAVLKRELLWKGSVVVVKVPKDARVTQVSNPVGDLSYAQFPQLVRGGVVNMHIHTGTPADLIGKTIKASVEVYKKEHADGREFIYVDFHPIADDTPVTHRLAVMQMIPGITRFAKEALVFETPAPLQGAVVIINHDQKFV